MWSKIVLVMLLVCLVGQVWSRPEVVAFACPTGYQYFHERCLRTEILKSVLEDLEK